MHSDSPVIPLDHIRSAVALLVAGLLHRQTIDHKLWDQAVVVLARSHDQLGGTTRQLLYTTLAAAHPASNPAELPAALTALAHNLDVPTVAPGCTSRAVRSCQLRLWT
jgi:hypothetical protein